MTGRLDVTDLAVLEARQDLTPLERRLLNEVLWYRMEYFELCDEYKDHVTELEAELHELRELSDLKTPRW